MNMVPAGVGSLTPEEAWRLTQYKWRYALEVQGFSEQEARRLIFLRWYRDVRPQAQDDRPE